jgi:hypothetical protein
MDLTNSFNMINLRENRDETSDIDKSAENNGVDQSKNSEEEVVRTKIGSQFRYVFLPIDEMLCFQTFCLKGMFFIPKKTPLVKKIYNIFSVGSPWNT